MCECHGAVSSRWASRLACASRAYVNSHQRPSGCAARPWCHLARCLGSAGQSWCSCQPGRSLVSAEQWQTCVTAIKQWIWVSTGTLDGLYSLQEACLTGVEAQPTWPPPFPNLERSHGSLLFATATVLWVASWIGCCGNGCWFKGVAPLLVKLFNCSESCFFVVPYGRAVFPLGQMDGWSDEWMDRCMDVLMFSYIKASTSYKQLDSLVNKPNTWCYFSQSSYVVPLRITIICRGGGGECEGGEGSGSEGSGEVWEKE